MAVGCRFGITDAGNPRDDSRMVEAVTSYLLTTVGHLDRLYVVWLKPPRIRRRFGMRSPDIDTTIQWPGSCDHISADNQIRPLQMDLKNLRNDISSIQYCVESHSTPHVCWTLFKWSRVTPSFNAIQYPFDTWKSCQVPEERLSASSSSFRLPQVCLVPHQEYDITRFHRTKPMEQQRPVVRADPRFCTVEVIAASVVTSSAEVASSRISTSGSL